MKCVKYKSATASYSIAAALSWCTVRSTYRCFGMWALFGPVPTIASKQSRVSYRTLGMTCFMV